MVYRALYAEQTGDVYRCATRRLLKSLSTEQRHVVVAGDHVIFRPDGDDEGFIERIDPRHGILSHQQGASACARREC